jgi:homocysteine S-methyltransferase
MQADLLGAYALGLRNLLLTTGDPHQMGDYIDTTAVFDVDSIGLTYMVHRLNQGVDVGEKSIGKPTGFVIGVGANPGTIAGDAEQLRRFNYKVEAGAEFALTQPVFDVALFERFLSGIENCKIPIIAGILPLPNFKTAEFMHYEVAGCSVPAPILERMRRAESRSADDAHAEGIAIAREILKSVRHMVQGVQIRGPFDRYETPLEVLS